MARFVAVVILTFILAGPCIAEATFEFLSAARNGSIWRKTKAKVASLAGDVPFAVLRDLLTQGIRGQLGVAPGSEAL